MAEGITFRMITDRFDLGIADRRKRMPRAAMWAVREAGRAAKKAARSKAPVLQDKSAPTATAVRRDAKFRAGGGVGPIRTANGPVRGLLRASITPSKHVKQLGTSAFSLKVGPRGERTHLYASKIEARAQYMEAGEHAAEAALAVAAEQAFNRVWKE